ncbi:MAG: Crp/Fnr family transcriptional regulator [Clostridiales bacterium]|nr:Crp/Fnr family transcriptional regulator [Clostridiales bacterium]
MTPELISFLKSKKAPQKFLPGEIIFHQGDEARELFYLISGLSLTYTILEDGRERNILISWPGRLFGGSTFFEGVNRRASAIALKTCEVIPIDRELYEECRREVPNFTDIIISELSKDVGVLFEQLVDSSLLSADIKVARFICRRIVHGQCSVLDGKPVLDYTQDFIASVLGLSRWSVSNALSSFREMGWISTNYGKLVVLDADSIRRFGYEEG